MMRKMERPIEGRKGRAKPGLQGILDAAVNDISSGRIIIANSEIQLFNLAGF